MSESKTMFTNSDKRFEGENLVIFDSTPYRLNDDVPMKLRYSTLLILNLNGGKAVKLKDSVGSHTQLVPSDYAYLYALENKLVPQLERLKLPPAIDGEVNMGSVQVIYGTKNTLKIVRSAMPMSSLRVYQTEQFGEPSTAEIKTLREADQAIETELDEIEDRINQLKAELKVLVGSLTKTKDRYVRALADTRQAERMADHVDMLAEDPSKYKDMVKAEFTATEKFAP